MATVNSGMFNLDAKALKKLERFYKNSPKQFMKAATFVLNEYAFGSRMEAIKEIERTMTVRSKGFVRSSIRFQKAKTGSLANMKSMVGSVEKPRADGFVTQLKGKDMKGRIATLYARGEKDKGKIKSKHRLKPGTKVYDHSDFNLDSSERSAMILLQKMDQGQYRNELFYLHTDYKSLDKGIYKITTQGKIRKVWNLGDHRNVSRNPWLTTAVRNFKKKRSAQEIWNEKLRIILKMPR